jgi:hypothetical protein
MDLDHLKRNNRNIISGAAYLFTFSCATEDGRNIVNSTLGLWWHGCAATQSGTEQVQDIYTAFELAYIMYKNKVGLTQCTET